MKTASFFTYTGYGRISIARYAPRNTPKGFRCYTKLAPGKWFNSVDREEYEALFKKEILDKLDPAKVYAELEELAHPYEPVLLCWEKPPFDDVKNWCHRRTMIAPWFENALGISVPEYERIDPRFALELPPQR